jgi:ATP-dependent DNA ligase
MKMGFHHGPALKCFHKDALKHYEGCHDLAQVCEDLSNPTWVFAPDIKPFQMLSPMLAARGQYVGNMHNVVKDLGGKFAIETKYDGDRIMCHKDGDIIRLFSRNHNEDPNACRQFKASRLLVQNLSQITTEERLIDEFRRQGAATVQVDIKERLIQGEDRRYAFVHFQDVDKCTAAFDRCKAKNISIDGKELDVSYDGLVIQNIRDCVRAQRCIVDGEMMTWDTLKKEWVPFGYNRSVCTNQSGRDEWTICFMIFDIIFIEDGLINLPGFATSPNLMANKYFERREILRRVVRERANEIEIVGVETPGAGRQQQIIVENLSKDEVSKKIADAMMDALECKCEGVILKSLDSVYDAGESGRSKTKWVKIKPDYIDETGDNVDLVILGGYYGDGRRRGNISHFLLGVANQKQMSKGSYQFQALCKVGSGYSDQQLGMLQQNLEPKWHEWSTDIPPACWASNYKPQKGEKPDVWILPHESVIMEVKYFCTIPSDKFNAGRTLRFPRCYAIRHDKEWNQGLSREGLRDIVEHHDQIMIANRDRMVRLILRLCCLDIAIARFDIGCW